MKSTIVETGHAGAHRDGKSGAAGLGAVLAPAVLMAMLGMAMLVVAGHVQSSALHAAAHDARHSSGLPCH